MNYYLKIVKPKNTFFHTYWGYTTDSIKSVVYFSENRIAISGFFAKLNSDDYVITLDGEYIVGRYNISCVPLDICYYLSQNKKYTVENILETISDNTITSNYYNVISSSQDVDIKDYLQCHCDVTAVLYKDNNYLDIVNSDFFNNVYKKIVKNVYYLNSQKLIFKQFSEEAESRYSDICKNIKRYNYTIYNYYSCTSIKTGRLSHGGSLNIMKMPSVIRKNIKPENTKLISFDISQAEPSILLSVAKENTNFDDIYVYIKNNLSHNSDNNRDYYKKLFYTFTYGTCTDSDSMKKMRNMFPKIYDFKQKLIKNTQKTSRIINIVGRTINSTPDKSMNHFLQSSLSDVFQLIVYDCIQNMKNKRSCIKYCVHDELSVDMHIEEIEDIIIDINNAKFKVIENIDKNLDLKFTVKK
jgi:hypothetical protein